MQRSALACCASALVCCSGAPPPTGRCRQPRSALCPSTEGRLLTAGGAAPAAERRHRQARVLRSSTPVVLLSHPPDTRFATEPTPSAFVPPLMFIRTAPPLLIPHAIVLRYVSRLSSCSVPLKQNWVASCDAVLRATRERQQRGGAGIAEGAHGQGREGRGGRYRQGVKARQVWRQGRGGRRREGGGGRGAGRAPGGGAYRP